MDTLTTSTSPATAALHAALAISESRCIPPTPTDALDFMMSKPMIWFDKGSCFDTTDNDRCSTLKRGRDGINLRTSFNMASLMAESIPIAEDIEFPKIEWDGSIVSQKDDDEEENERDIDAILIRPSKRRCSGLTRSKRIVSNLSRNLGRRVSLDSLAN
uniref:Uncharacterized protein n=1 Tax=Craspedostauros australis TaxID=1486917 RepID=A0A7R9ZMM7_9STRA|mmetsp:Transcript_20416/g.56811  ORF Transcript_20416/g.56811 Transcript_20416/m.56811 type:complete len:159 (+) Transcript_20416:76-552(+)